MATLGDMVVQSAMVDYQISLLQPFSAKYWAKDLVGSQLGLLGFQVESRKGEPSNHHSIL